MQAVANITVFSLFFIRTILKVHEPEIWQKFKSKLRTILGWFFFFLKTESIRLHALLTTLYWCRYVWEKKQILKKKFYVVAWHFPLFSSPINRKSASKLDKKLRAGNLKKNLLVLIKERVYMSLNDISYTHIISSQIHQ